MVTPQEKQLVRWKPDNGEIGRPIRDNMYVEEVTLEWNIGGEEQGRLPPQNGMQESDNGVESQKAQKTEDRQKRTTLLRCETAE